MEIFLIRIKLVFVLQVSYSTMWIEECDCSIIKCVSRSTEHSIGNGT